MLLEALVPLLWVLLYRSVSRGLTLPMGVRATSLLAGVSTPEAWGHFAALSGLMFLLLIATFIDIDERTIPDWITIPGTWLGALGATAVPGWCLWEARPMGPPTFSLGAFPLHADSPYPWDLRWGQMGWSGSGMWACLAIWWVWCLSLGNLRWITRRGWSKAFRYAWAGFWRSPNLPLVFGMAGVGSGLLACGYAFLPADRWQALFSSVMGIGLGGGLVWSFRIVASGVLGQEALGFGDVTLMAMVGAFFGWQIVLIAFFLAPLFGIILVLLIWVLTRDGTIPFGPYLAAATAYTALDWSRVWDSVSPAFPSVGLYFLFLGGLLVVLGSLLWVVRSLKVWMGG
jgi:prepilin signal peptidase PulO-like enzyme (type II secretory pathway)